MHSWFEQSHLQGQCADTAGISLEGGIPLKGPKSMKVLGNIACATIQTEMGVRSSVACSATRPFASSEQEAYHSNLRWEIRPKFSSRTVVHTALPWYLGQLGWLFSSQRSCEWSKPKQTLYCLPQPTNIIQYHFKPLIGLAIVIVLWKRVGTLKNLNSILNLVATFYHMRYTVCRYN